MLWGGKRGEMAAREEKGVSLFTADDTGTFEAVSAAREETSGHETARGGDGPDRYKVPGLTTPEVNLPDTPPDGRFPPPSR